MIEKIGVVGAIGVIGKRRECELHDLKLGQQARRRLRVFRGRRRGWGRGKLDVEFFQFLLEVAETVFSAPTFFVRHGGLQHRLSCRSAHHLDPVFQRFVADDLAATRPIRSG